MKKKTGRELRFFIRCPLEEVEILTLIGVKVCRTYAKKAGGAPDTAVPGSHASGCLRAGGDPNVADLRNFRHSGGSRNPGFFKNCKVFLDSGHQRSDVKSTILRDEPGPPRDHAESPGNYRPQGLSNAIETTPPVTSPRSFLHAIACCKFGTNGVRSRPISRLPRLSVSSILT